MHRTANLRRQHDAAIVLAEQILDRLDGPPPSETEAYALGMTLAKLTGLLRIHFAQEDKVLYPYMIGSAHAEAASTAADFQHEMGDLSAVYGAFVDRWASGRAIGADYANFRDEARGVLAALADRITRENEQLYPLADAIGPDQARQVA